MQPGNEVERPSLLLNLAVIVGAVLAVNGLIFGLRRNDAAGPALVSFLNPPGWVVGVVWTLLFVLLAVARWRLGGPATAAERGWVTGLIVYCLAYPFYAVIPQSMIGAFLGSLGTIPLASYVAWRVWPASRSAAACVAPIVPWVVFATATILADWGWFGWHQVTTESESGSITMSKPLRIKVMNVVEYPPGGYSHKTHSLRDPTWEQIEAAIRALNHQHFWHSFPRTNQISHRNPRFSWFCFVQSRKVEILS